MPDLHRRAADLPIDFPPRQKTARLRSKRAAEKEREKIPTRDGRTHEGLNQKCYSGSTLSADRFGFLGRGLSSFVLAALGIVASQSCGFPDYTFIQDKDFYGKGSGGKKGN